MLINLYKNFILFCFVISTHEAKYTYLLFDITKGRFQGKVFIPRKDICYTDKYDVILGWHRKILITCETKGVKHVTIYDSIEYNITGYLNLILRNGISILLRSIPLEIMISKGGDVYSGCVYNVIVYRLQTRYQPVKHKFRHTRLFRHSQACAYRIDIWSDILYMICQPGPVAIAFLNSCDPVDGIARKRSGNNMIFHELIPSFHPSDQNPDSEHFYFSVNGSLLHLIRSPKKTPNMKEYLSSVDIYIRMRS
jgi:hypothetical protein